MGQQPAVGATRVWEQERDTIKSVFIRIPRTKPASVRCCMGCDHPAPQPGRVGLCEPLGPALGSSLLGAQPPGSPQFPGQSPPAVGSGEGREC